MSDAIPTRGTFRGTSPTVEPPKVFDPDKDTVSWWRSIFDKDYMSRVEEGRRLYAARLQAEADEIAAQKKVDIERVNDILEYNLELSKAILAGSDTYVRSGAANSRGGAGKSSLSASIASALADCSKDNPLIIDNNQAMGIVAKYLGIPEGSGMTVREAAERADHGELRTSAEYSVRLRKSIYGVKLLRSDDVVEQEDLYGRDVAIKNMKLSQQHYPIVFNDTGNGIQDAASGGVWDMLNVLMLPARRKESHLDLSRKTRETLYGWRVKKPHFATLIENGITVVVGLEPGEVLESYRERLQLPADRLLFAQPFDERMDQEKSIDFTLSSIYFQIACREVALLNLIIAQRQEEGHPLTADDRLLLKTGHLVKLKSGRTPVLPWIDGSDPIAIEQKGE